MNKPTHHWRFCLCHEEGACLAPPIVLDGEELKHTHPFVDFHCEMKSEDARKEAEIH